MTTESGAVEDNFLVVYLWSASPITTSQFYAQPPEQREELLEVHNYRMKLVLRDLLRSVPVMRVSRY